jgi:glycosyltransferase involved in cell wall biosynthesis
MFTSIVIPTFNNYSQLADCIQSINDHSKGHAYEIIIMDNGPQPLGYTEPMVRGMHAAKGELIISLNDDCLITEDTWLEPLIETAGSGAWVFSPDHPDEQNMKAAAWCLCFSREGYIGVGDYDLQFKIWCSDIDMFKRCEQHGKPVFRVEGSGGVTHQYSSTSSSPEIQDTVQRWQQEDLAKYRAKWGTDPNIDKLVTSSQYLQA